MKAPFLLTSAPGHLISMMGAPGAGKSTYATRFPYVVSTDALRATDDAAEISRVFAQTMKALAAFLNAGGTVVLDTMAENVAIRKQALALARRFHARASLVLLDTDLEICCERQRQRSNPVPIDMVRALHASIQAQRERVTHEGWDDITVVKTG